MKDERQRDGLGAAGVSAEGLLEGRGRHLLDGEAEDVAVGTEALEGPGEVGLVMGCSP